VIGYPAKNLHPAVKAASAQALFPCQKYVPGGIGSGIKVPFFRVCGCKRLEIKPMFMGIETHTESP
jgi:hypothetical protein